MSDRLKPAKDYYSSSLHEPVKLRDYKGNLNGSSSFPVFPGMLPKI